MLLLSLFIKPISYKVMSYLGIYPLDSERVDWNSFCTKSSQHAAPEVAFDILDKPTDPTYRCPKCGRSDPCDICFKTFAASENVLVKMGLVDPILYKICMPSTSSENTCSLRKESVWSTSQCTTGTINDNGIQPYR